MRQNKHPSPLSVLIKIKTHLKNQLYKFVQRFSKSQTQILKNLSSSKIQSLLKNKNKISHLLQIILYKTKSTFNMVSSLLLKYNTTIKIINSALRWTFVKILNKSSNHEVKKCFPKFLL